jgi:galactokinase
VAGIEATPVRLAMLCQRAENEFVGVQCGIMDQLASALGKDGHALLIDCRSLEVEHVPLRLDEADVSVVIVDSKVPRRLADTPYNQRREECAEAAHRLGVPALRDAALEQVESLPEPLNRRGRHVVRENQRVLDAMQALKARDFDRFGALMRRSHESMRDDFEASCPELDLLVELAVESPGVLGARLTGAGFGGCTVNLVRSESIEELRRTVSGRYERETGLQPCVYVCRPSEGLRVLNV